MAGLLQVLHHLACFDRPASRADGGEEVSSVLATSADASVHSLPMCADQIVECATAGGEDILWNCSSEADGRFGYSIGKCKSSA